MYPSFFNNINFNFERSLVLEGDPGSILESVGRRKILVSLHHPLSVAHRLAQLKTLKNYTIFHKPLLTFFFLHHLSYLFTIDGVGHLFDGRGPRRVVLGLLQGEPVGANGGRNENFLFGRTHSADQVDQAVGVEHVEKAHESGGVEGPVGLVGVPEVVRSHREQIDVPAEDLSIRNRECRKNYSIFTGWFCWIYDALHYSIFQERDL